MKLEEIMSYLTPDKSSTSRLDLNAGLARVDYSITGILDGKSFESITMLSNTQRAVIPIKPTSRVLVRFEDGEIKVFQFKPAFKEKAQWSFLNELLQSGGTAIDAFNEYGEKRDKIWDSLGTKARYTPEIQQFYSTLHQGIADNILHALESDPVLKQKAESSGVQLISIGCGSGADLLCSYKALLKARAAKVMECVGIDSNAKEILRAKEANPKNFVFIDHNIGDLATLSSKLTLKPDRVVIIISSGSLTREVMQGAYEVLKALHAMQAHLSPDLVCIGGYTHVILTQEIAYNAGFSAEINYHGATGRNIFMLSQQTPHYQMAWLLARSHNRRPELDTLDMSMCSSPLSLCELLPSARKEKITAIDFSWSNIQPGEMAKIVQVVKEFPKLKDIILSRREPWAKEFVDSFESLNKYTLLQRRDCADADELPQIDIKTAQALNCYAELPVTKIFTPGDKVAPKLAAEGLFAVKELSSATGPKKESLSKFEHQLPHVGSK